MWLFKPPCAPRLIFLNLAVALAYALAGAFGLWLGCSLKSNVMLFSVSEI